MDLGSTPSLIRRKLAPTNCPSSQILRITETTTATHYLSMPLTAMAWLSMTFIHSTATWWLKLPTNSLPTIRSISELMLDLSTWLDQPSQVLVNMLPTPWPTNGDPGTIWSSKSQESWTWTSSVSLTPVQMLAVSSVQTMTNWTKSSASDGSNSRPSSP